MRAFAHLSASELRLLSRDPATLFFMVAFPAMLLLLNGSNDHLEVFVPGYLAMVLAIGGISTLPGVMAGYRERKVLRRLATTPVSPFVLLTAQIAAQLAMALAGAAVLVGVAVIGFGVAPPAHPAALALAFLLCALMCYAIGFVLAALAPRARTADMMGLLVMFPMIFLAGAAIPREGVPGELREIGAYLPLTQGVTALRESWLGQPTPMPFLLVSAIIVLGTAIAVALFRWE
ncbi:integral membrane protein [[Actinomadura] parvosata subsp. kistnae]|uniref:Transport permease protein n=1 Tax=[Actinomadura] parvosata subsp. kistnae TaxID=1909395 RepID=A0A1U9ZQU6_9ACTN|nr:ABC transporter permease [Nonomuraea sp. ATCC 55076]AQZ60298.1 multidrug ABC transporter permease [Nonomuraea sp. ATCC 55076]SPL91205.1 integral membrane protein [Actinomadura parvosata subsp. kistnae]